MATTQSEDPSERVQHPRHYNQHPSNIETIELIEHLPYNLGAAVKYIWRCGLKKTETPLRDLQSAKWYTEREDLRVEQYELEDEPPPKTTVVWRALARKVIAADTDSALAEYLNSLLNGDFYGMSQAIENAIEDLGEEPEKSSVHEKECGVEQKRAKYVAASQGEREKMLMGALSALAEDVGAKAHITRGRPTDYK